MATEPSQRTSRRWRWSILLLVGFVGLAVWLMFFDSYSLLNRYQWHQETEQLRQENKTLGRRIKALEKKLEAGPSDEDIERIAREQYGMRRPDETVYRIAPTPEGSSSP